MTNELVPATIVRRLYDKSTWGYGAWQKEPDHILWLDWETQMPCMIIRNESLGHLCGYVGVLEGSPLWKVHYNEVYADVHGGLTWSDFYSENIVGVAHDKIWWFGFDCAHLNDYEPAMAARYGANFATGSYDQYKSVKYVQYECTKLALRIREIESQGFIEKGDSDGENDSD